MIRVIVTDANGTVLDDCDVYNVDRETLTLLADLGINPNVIPY